MQPNEIYKSLERMNVSARMIATALGVTNQSVSEVIRNGKGSRRIAESVAKVIQKDLEEVFPYYAVKNDRLERIHKLKEVLHV